MAAYDQLVWMSVFVGLILVARLLVTRPAQRLLAPRLRRLGDWTVERMNRPEPLDPEAEEMALFLRRQRLVAQLDRVRRLLVADEHMSATRQLGNRLAYASLVADLARLPEVYPMAATPSASVVRSDRRRGSTVEVLDVGWR
jgi:hypothetical protein